MQEAFMPAWAQFRAAYVSGLPNYETIESLRRLEQLLDLPVQQAQDEFEKQYSAAEPRELYQKLNLLNKTIQREIGIPLGPNAPAEAQKLVQECQLASTLDENIRPHNASGRYGPSPAPSYKSILASIKVPGLNKSRRLACSKRASLSSRAWSRFRATPRRARSRPNLSRNSNPFLPMQTS
jgi:hypothetical protein